MVGEVDIGNLSTPDYSRHHAGGNLQSEQYFGEIKNESFFRTSFLIKKQKTFYSRNARPSAGYMLKRKGLSMGKVQHLVRGHRPTPHRVTANMAFFS